MKEKSESRNRLGKELFEEFADLIRSDLGIKMPEAKETMLYSRLQRRMRALEMDSLEDYRERLLNSPHSEEEFIHFTDVVTTNKTDFFREPAHFDYLSRSVLPTLDRSPSLPYHVNVWCAGCSSGEEAYTLSMVLSEQLLVRDRFSYSILGTDVSSRVLDLARQAVYPEDRIAPVSETLRKRYLLRSRDSSKRLIRIAAPQRKPVSFQRLNFMDENYGVKERFDVIFFRNVMIYFDRPTQEAVVNKLCRNLNPGGYLFIGHSESLSGLNVPLKLVSSSVFKKNG